MCEEARKGEFEIVIVAKPEILGDDYEEVIGNLRRWPRWGCLLQLPRGRSSDRKGMNRG